MALDRPVRMLVLGGEPSLDADASDLGLALAAGLSAVSPSAIEGHPPCGGQPPNLHCMTENQAEVGQVLVYVGDTGRIDVVREQFVDDWVTAGGDVIAVLPAGANPDMVTLLLVCAPLLLVWSVSGAFAWLRVPASRGVLRRR